MPSYVTVIGVEARNADKAQLLEPGYDDRTLNGILQHLEALADEAQAFEVAYLLCTEWNSFMVARLGAVGAPVVHGVSLMKGDTKVELSEAMSTVDVDVDADAVARFIKAQLGLGGFQANADDQLDLRSAGFSSAQKAARAFAYVALAMPPSPMKQTFCWVDQKLIEVELHPKRGVVLELLSPSGETQDQPLIDEVFAVHSPLEFPWGALQPCPPKPAEFTPAPRSDPKRPLMTGSKLNRLRAIHQTQRKVELYAALEHPNNRRLGEVRSELLRRLVALGGADVEAYLYDALFDEPDEELAERIIACSVRFDGLLERWAQDLLWASHTSPRYAERIIRAISMDHRHVTPQMTGPLPEALIARLPAVLHERWRKYKAQ